MLMTAALKNNNIIFAGYSIVTQKYHIFFRKLSIINYCKKFFSPFVTSVSVAIVVNIDFIIPSYSCFKDKYFKSFLVYLQNIFQRIVAMGDRNALILQAAMELLNSSSSDDEEFLLASAVANENDSNHRDMLLYAAQLFCDSSSSEDEDFVCFICGMRRERPKIKHYIEDVVNSYSDEEV